MIEFFKAHPFNGWNEKATATGAIVVCLLSAASGFAIGLGARTIINLFR
jgi:hypothetical protein